MNSQTKATIEIALPHPAAAEEVTLQVAFPLFSSSPPSTGWTPMDKVAVTVAVPAEVPEPSPVAFAPAISPVPQQEPFLVP